MLSISSSRNALLPMRSGVAGALLALACGGAAADHPAPPADIAAVCAAGATTAAASPAIFPVAMQAVRAELAAGLATSEVAAERAAGIYLRMQAEGENLAGAAPVAGQSAAQQLAQLATAGQTGDHVYAMAYAACHLGLQDDRSGNCATITLQDWVARAPASQLPAMANIQTLRIANDLPALDRALAALGATASPYPQPYPQYLPLAQVVDSQVFRQLPQPRKDLAAMYIAANSDLYSLRPLLLSYCRRGDLADETRKQTCLSTATALLSHSQLLSDNFEALRVARLAGLSREQLAASAGATMALRKAVKKDFSFDKNFNCDTLRQRGKLAMSVIEQGEVTAYRDYLAPAMAAAKAAPPKTPANAPLVR